MNITRILQAITLISLQGRNDQRTLRKVNDYDTSNVSEKVIRIIMSYTDYVDRYVWKKLI